MTAPDVNADVRARFEAWAMREGYALDRMVDGGYHGIGARNAWAGYLAAHADLSGEVRELVEIAKVFDNLIGGRMIRDTHTVHNLQVRAIDLYRLQEALAKLHPAQPEE